MTQASPERPPLTFIAAVARNGVMGKDGKLPWTLPEDLAFFRNMTMGHSVIMGRRTWDERGVPLDGRRNIVVSRSGIVSGAGREVASTIEDAIALARASDPDPFVLGGAEIFRIALPYATRMLITEIDFDADGDTFFPPFDRAAWRVTASRRGDRATYVTYERSGVSEQPRAISVGFDGDDLVVSLADGRSVHVPLAWFPRLAQAKHEDLNDWRLIGQGVGIHWPRLDEDLSVSGLLSPGGTSRRPAKD